MGGYCLVLRAFKTRLTPPRAPYRLPASHSHLERPGSPRLLAGALVDHHGVDAGRDHHARLVPENRIATRDQRRRPEPGPPAGDGLAPPGARPPATGSRARSPDHGARGHLRGHDAEGLGLDDDPEPPVDRRVAHRQTRATARLARQRPARPTRRHPDDLPFRRRRLRRDPASPVGHHLQPSGPQRGETRGGCQRLRRGASLRHQPRQTRRTHHLASGHAAGPRRRRDLCLLDRRRRRQSAPQLDRPASDSADRHGDRTDQTGGLARRGARRRGNPPRPRDHATGRHRSARPLHAGAPAAHVGDRRGPRRDDPADDRQATADGNHFLVARGELRHALRWLEDRPFPRLRAPRRGLGGQRVRRRRTAADRG